MRATAGINHYAHDPQYAWRDTQDDLVHKFETDLELTATCTDPEERAGDTYTLMIYGDASQDLLWKLKDI